MNNKRADRGSKLLEQKGQFPRRQLLVKPLQVKYASLLALVLMLFLILSEVELYFVIKLLVNASAAVDTMAQVKKLQLIILTAGYVFIALVLFIALLFSHRIAGPLYRIEKIINNITETGNIDQKIVLRKSDELHELAEALNKMFAVLKDKYERK